MSSATESLDGGTFAPPHRRAHAGSAPGPNTLGGSELDRESLVAQTHAIMLEQIESGSWPAGERLPSEHELAAQLGVSRPTIRGALGLLEHQGRVIRRSGAGTFVKEQETAVLLDNVDSFQGLDEIAAAQGIELLGGEPTVETLVAGAEIGKRLGLDPGAKVHVVTRTLSMQTGPAIHMVDVVPAHLVDADRLREIGQGVIRPLIEELVPDVSYTEIQISAVLADRHLASRLELAPGALVLISDETVHTEAGDPVEVSYNYYNPGRVMLKTTQRRLTR